ncbi:hypothetical protein [Rhizobium ruizarguesonis]|jgi:hypothetical protein|uniref:hypothetical protein n=1 Tax=Rhizobium ruizarguesonis TaxID=2081791 RepID=UPI00102F4FE0|nr:hypothetical protein [Rhizobium ruizarguesonis]TBA16079.1 hypothetical protein ELH65_08910 [Rhizobium ruizarguesonis]TBA80304.1 hypothetical protein ELH56_08685 [Rhizobium ruizarguesonis]
MSIELGSWVLPLGVTIVAFAFALASVKAGVPFYDRTVNSIFNMLILSLAAIASLSTWIAWALVIR